MGGVDETSQTFPDRTLCTTRTSKPAFPPCAGSASRAKQPRNGQVAEWSKAHAWKVCRRETVSRVRIPVCPPLNLPVKDITHYYKTISSEVWKFIPDFAPLFAPQFPPRLFRSVQPRLGLLRQRLKHCLYLINARIQHHGTCQHLVRRKIVSTWVFDSAKHLSWEGWNANTPSRSSAAQHAN